jgi:hypothetical protein
MSSRHQEGAIKLRKNLRFGYGFDFRNPPEWKRPFPQLYAEHLEFISWIETIGFGNVFLAEHHGIDDGYLPSPLAVAAAIAGRTNAIRIGTGVGLAPFYHPVRLAEDAAVIDNLSNGRFELTLGIGYLPHEAAAYGFDFKKRGKQSDELLHVVRRLWQGETVTFHGEIFNIENARVTPPPVQKNGIPLWIGGTTAPGFRRAARYGDGFNGPVENWPDYLEALRAEGKDESQARIMSMSASDMWFAVSEDPERTLEEIAPHCYYQLNTYSKWQNEAGWGGVQAVMPLEDFKKSGAVKVMTPQDAIAYIKSRQALAPIEVFCMQTPAGYPLKRLAEHVELFANKVMPAFA